MSILSGISRIATGAVKSAWGGLRTVAKPLAFALAPIAVGGVMLGHTLAQNLPFKIGEKYTKIYESTAGKIVDTFSMKEGFADFKSGITDMKDGLVGGEGTDANRAAIEQAKIDQKMQQEQHAHDLKIKEVEHKQAMESKKADLKADLTKTKMQDRKETREARNERRHKMREGRNERRHERRKARTERRAKTAELENDLYKHQDTEATKRHEANQTLAGTLDTNQTSRDTATLTSGDARYQAKQTRLTEENKHQQTLTQQATDDAKQAAKEAADQAKEAADKAAKEAIENAGYVAMITKANSFVNGGITDPDTQISQAETLRNNLATIPAGIHRANADSAETALNTFIKNCQKDKEDKKAAKENLSIVDNISKAELFAKGATTGSITDLNKKIGTAESLRNNLPTLPTGHTEETRLKGAINDLNTFIETCQASIDRENVDNAIKPSADLRSKYTPITKIKTTKECNEIIDKAVRIKSSLNPNSITTIAESNRVKQEQNDLQQFIDDVETHKTDPNTLNAIPKFSQSIIDLVEPCNTISFDIDKNTNYKVIIKDAAGKPIGTPHIGDSGANTSIDIPTNKLTSGKYIIDFETSNAFGPNNGKFTIEVEPKPITKPKITFDSTTKEMLFEGMDDENLTIEIKNNNKSLYNSDKGDGKNDITISTVFNNLAKGDHALNIVITDPKNPKRAPIKESIKVTIP